MGNQSKLSRQKSNLKFRFNMTLEEYDAMFEEQGGVCAICSGINKDGRRLAVDHNHKTGKIRGLLCVKCNRLLGLANENVKSLSKAIDYLINHKTQRRIT